MDEEVLLESSPLYEHLKHLDKNEFDISAVRITKDANTSHPSVDVDKVHAHNSKESVSQPKSFFNIQQAQARIRSEICRDLLNCPNLSTEYLTVLHPFLECYHSQLDDTASAGFSLSRLMVHGAVTCACMCLSFRTLKLVAAASLCCHLAVPFFRCAVQNVFTRKLHQNRCRISKMLLTFSQSISVLTGVEKLLQELRLISLGAGRSGSLSPAKGTEHMTVVLTDAAQSYTHDCIAKLKPEVQFLTKHVELSLLPSLQLFCSEPISSDESSARDSLKKNHKLLRLLISQWIFSLAVVVQNTTSTDTFEQQISTLEGLTPPHQLEKDLQFYKALLDGDEPTHVAAPKKFPSKQDQAMHSLYLHSRELLRLAKLAGEDNSLRTEEVFSRIASELRDCTACLNIASKTNKPLNRTGKGELSVKSLEAEVCQPPAEQPDTLIDQVFITEEGGIDEELPTSEAYDMEVQLHREYQAALMRELNGVIHELAKERMKRESQLQDTNGLSVDAIAKITQDLVQNRDIKTMVKANVPEGLEQPSASIQERPHRLEPRYKHADGETGSLNISSEMKQLAEMVAERFTHQQEYEETFGSDSDSES